MRVSMFSTPLPALVFAASLACAQSGEVRTGAAAFDSWKADAPGVGRHFKSSDLPPPETGHDAETSRGSNVKIVAPPKGALPKVPDGFAVQVFAGGFKQPRTLRVAPYLGQAIGISPRDVSANVLGEHGTSSVLHWSGVTVGGIRLAEALECARRRLEQVQPRVEDAVRAANLNIIEGLDASQYGIGAVVARLTEAVLRDEKMVAPVGSCQKDGLTYSLPSVIGANGVEAVLEPQLSATEKAALQQSIEALRKAGERASALRR